MKRQMGPELQALWQRVERWRRQRPNRATRIPQELWDEAVRVVAIEGLSATARALRFEYYALKKHVEQAGGASELSLLADSDMQALPETDFVQVQMPRFDAGLVVELTSRDGDRMRIEAGDSARVDVVGTVVAFWSRAS